MLRVLLPSRRPVLGREVIPAPREPGFEPVLEGAPRRSGAAKPDAMRSFREVESVCGALARAMRWPALNYVPVILTGGNPDVLPPSMAKPQLPGGKAPFSS